MASKKMSRYVVIQGYVLAFKRRELYPLWIRIGSGGVIEMPIKNRQRTTGVSPCVNALNFA